MQQVLTARVPIIKFEMLESGLAFDVAWDQRSGPAGAALVRQLLAAWPVMKPLVLVLKVRIDLVLSTRNLRRRLN
jgi:non-canonical poly(A) RNA polymerase PAPD5/7